MAGRKKNEMPLPVEGEAQVAEKKAPAKKGPFQVVALRPGYFGGSRKKVDEKFTVKTEQELGSWMKII